MTALCWVTDCSAFGGSFFAASAPFSGGFSGGFSCARALPPRTAARASIAATFRITVPPLFAGTCRAKISRIAARRASSGRFFGRMDPRVRHRTVGVAVGRVQVGGGAPVVVQSMTMTDTADVARDGPAVHRAGARPAPRWSASRSTCPRPRAAVPEIKQRMLDAGCDGAAHRRLPLQRAPPADEVSRTARGRSTSTGSTPATSARARGATSSSRRSATSRVDHGKPVRIGVNGGSLNQELVMREDAGEHRPRSRHARPKRSSTSAWCSRRSSRRSSRSRSGLRKDQIIISCKISRPRDLIAVYRDARASRPISRCTSA